MRSYCFNQSIGEKKLRELSGSLGCGAGTDVGVGAGGDAPTSGGDGIGDICLSKKNTSGLDDWSMLLPLNP